MDDLVVGLALSSPNVYRPRRAPDRSTRRKRHTGPIQEIRNRVEKCRMLSNWNGSYSLTSDSIGMLYPLDRWAERGALADRDAMCGANASDGIRREEGGVASIDVLWNFGAYKPIFLSYPVPKAFKPRFGLGAHASIRSTM